MRATFTPLYPLPILALLTLIGMLGPTAQGACDAACGTTVPPGNIIKQTWTVDGSPYCVTGNITAFGLTIQPGVCVLIDGPYAIEAVLINAVGSAEQPIIFTSKIPGTKWKGFNFQAAPEGSELAYCIIEESDNSAIRILNSSPLIRNCLIVNNSTTGQGGAVNATLGSGDLTIKDCVIKNNASAGHGGAIRASTTNNSKLVLDGCRVTGNASNPASAPAGTNVGGGLYLTGMAEIVSCQFALNSCQAIIPNCCGGSSFAYGGGIYIDGAEDVDLNGVVINDNIAYSSANCCGCGGYSGIARGAGLYWNSSGSLTLDNCSIVCNQTNFNFCGDASGSGIWINGGTATVTNCTIAKNNRHGLYHAGGTVTMRNSIIFFNNSLGGNPETFGSQMVGAVTATYSDIQGDALFPGDGNINVTPAFAGNSCPCGDFSLIVVTPVKDKGDPDPLYNDMCFPPSYGALRNDLGATGGPGTCSMRSIRPADITGNWKVDVDDLLSVINNWGPCPNSATPCIDDIAPCGGDGFVNVDDLLTIINGWG